jgi:branched-chain amino acid transport system ATP-binding protein
MVTERETGAGDLVITGLHVSYKRVHEAVAGVSLRVPPGQVVALIGSNGAGKTSTLRAASGFLPIDRAAITRGTITLAGSQVHGLSPSAAVRRGIVLVPERTKVFAGLSVEDNLRAVRERGSARDKAAARELVDELFPVLVERRDQLAGFLSGGERQMLAIARALLLRPQMLLVDELSFGLAPALAARLLRTIATISHERGIGALVVEQNVTEALAVADHAYVMERGRIVLDGAADQLRDDPRVARSYLGTGGDGGQGSYLQTRRGRRRWS